MRRFFWTLGAIVIIESMPLVSSAQQCADQLKVKSFVSTPDLVSCLAELKDRLSILENSKAPSGPTKVLFSSPVEISGPSGSQKLPFTTDVPGILIITAQGTASFQGQKADDTQIRVSMSVDGSLCAADYSITNYAMSVKFDSSASCIRQLDAGSHNVLFWIEGAHMDSYELSGNVLVLWAQ